MNICLKILLSTQVEASNKFLHLGGSPGLVVMGGDSRSEGRGFKSKCHILDGHFFTLICCNIVLMFVWKRPKINKKEAGDSAL